MSEENKELVHADTEAEVVKEKIPLSQAIADADDLLTKTLQAECSVEGYHKIVEALNVVIDLNMLGLDMYYREKLNLDADKEQ